MKWVALLSFLAATSGMLSIGSKGLTGWWLAALERVVKAASAAMAMRLRMMAVG